MPAAGVPASVAVPSPLSTKVTPPGRAPRLAQSGGREAGGGDRERARRARGEGGVSALVIAGAWSTVRVKLWVASGTTPLAAVMVSV